MDETCRAAKARTADPLSAICSSTRRPNELRWKKRFINSKIQINFRLTPLKTKGPFMNVGVIGLFDCYWQSRSRLSTPRGPLWRLLWTAYTKRLTAMSLLFSAHGVVYNINETYIIFMFMRMGCFCAYVTRRVFFTKGTSSSLLCTWRRRH